MASEVFLQEAGGVSQTLRFEDARLVWAIADARGARELSLPYWEIDVEHSQHVPAPRRFRAFALAAGLLAALAAMGAGSYLRWALAAAALCALALAVLRKGPLAQTRFALLDPRRRGEPLIVLCDGQQARIEAELRSRWKAFRREIVRVDFAADPGHETARFHRLHQRGLVSAEECLAALGRIAAGGPAQ